MIQFSVDPTSHGLRLDKYIMSQNHALLYSRSLIEKLIATENVCINHNICTKKSHPLKTNDLISISVGQNGIIPLSVGVGFQSTRSEAPPPQNLPLNIIYQDPHLAIIDKPAGLVVHPAPGNHTGTLVNALLHHLGKNIPTQNILRPGIVHRLDKHTSGLLIIAKDDKTHFLLSNLFATRQISKTYLCICCGVPDPPTADITLPILRHKTDRKKMSTNPLGRPAHSRYRVIEDLQYFALCEVDLLTGRTHQIRVHMTAINHPILGDTTYSSQKQALAFCPQNMQTAIKHLLKNKLTRQALHSHKLSFVHPITNQPLTFQSEPPTDIQDTLATLHKLINNR